MTTASSRTGKSAALLYQPVMRRVRTYLARTLTKAREDNCIMNFLHYELQLGPNDIVQVSLNKQANVRLLDEGNFAKYKRGEHHSYYGGLAKKSPANIPSPRSGHWYLVIDLGGYPGRVRASVKIIGR